MKLSTQYRGFLTHEQIAAGMSAADQNASRLAEDADLLLEAHRFPTTASLALLSLEESDKSRILRGMINATTQKAVVELWKSYRRHIDKHSLMLLLDRFSRGARRLSDFSDCVTDRGADEKQIYDLVKQLGFYTDCIGDAHWSLPLEVIDEGLATVLVRSAKIMSKRRHRVSVRELELWAIHMHSGDTRENLLAWARAMESEGLHPEGYAQQMVSFTEGL